jgi:hypothetical protein
MLLLAAAAIAASPPQDQPRSSSATAQATATIRIISGVRLSLGEDRNPGAPVTSRTLVRADGRLQDAKLIEFE